MSEAIYKEKDKFQLLKNMESALNLDPVDEQHNCRDNGCWAVQTAGAHTLGDFL